jgi:hypothetical protein
MKKTFPILLIYLLIISNISKAQNNTIIEKRFLNYYQLLVDFKFDKAVDYTNDDFFKVIPRDQIVNALQAVFTSPAFDYKLEMPKLSDFEKKR